MSNVQVDDRDPAIEYIGPWGLAGVPQEYLGMGVQHTYYLTILIRRRLGRHILSWPMARHSLILSMVSVYLQRLVLSD